MARERLAVSLQENLLVLLSFNARASVIIRNAVEPNLFSSQIFRDVVIRCYEYIDEYRQPPADHLPDLLESELAGDQSAEYIHLLESLSEHRDTINEEYTLNQLEKFVRQQTLKSSIISASEAIQEGDLDLAETNLQEGMKQRLKLFSPGSTLADSIRLIYAKEVRKNIVPLGIKELDKWDLGPARGEFHLFIGPPKKGKSWWLIHVTKRCIIHRMKVAYITLELSEAQIGQRLIQSLFSITRSKASVPITRLMTDDLGRLMRFDRDKITHRPSLDDPSSRGHVEKRVGQVHGIDNLRIKQFPAGQLTVKGLTGYLDMLERSTNFIPDVVVIDYPDYMKIDPKNYRFEVGALYNDLRGMAVERNQAVVVASRSNREGAKARLVTETNAAEDFSRIYTADTIFTYTQTAAERELGLARLFVSSTRVAERDQFVVLMSQAYPVGQFCLSSALLADTYWGLLEQAGHSLNSESGDGGEE